MLVISNQPRVTRKADLKSLTQLPHELNSTQSYYHQKLKKKNRKNALEYKDWKVSFPKELWCQGTEGVKKTVILIKGLDEC